MHNVITQGKERQTLPMFQGYGPARYKNCKTNIFVPREHGPSKKAGKVKGTKRGGTLIHALEKRLRERERENHSRGARPPNLLNIAFCGLTSTCLHPCPFRLRLGGCTLAPSFRAPCVYMQRQKRQASKQEKETR